MLDRMMADNGFPSPVAESGGCRVFQFHSETGEGIMTQYDLFPSVYLMYNDFHMESYDSVFRTTEDMLCIDYCRQGRMEYPAGPDSYSYVEAGDLKLDRRLEHQGHFTFPLSHYHGITIGFTLPLAAQSLKEWVREFPVDLVRLQEKFCASRHPRVIHGATSVDHIFQELYAVPEQIKLPYNKNYAAYMEANAHVNSVIVEYVEGIQVVKAFSQGERSYQKFAQAVSSFKAFTMDWYRCTWASMNLCLSILPTTLLGTLPMGVYLYQAGVLDPAQVTLCLMMALGIVAPLMSATAFINSMKSMQFAVKDTRELLDLPQLSQAGQDMPLDGCSIQLKDVSFSYGGSDGKEVLHHLDLTIPQGKFTALVGPSGGGKSTIARLAARFWDVTGGSITLGGRDIRELPLKQLSREISFVTQDNFLFDCSLKENIRLGRPGASDEEVFAAARAAQCEEFIGRLEHGWDTAAGDAGKQLSGGERQRITIARAILKDAPIVILDEATAFTDPENEDKIQRSIMALSKGKTLLVIAHRLSTIQNADQIVVLEKGQVVDRGTQRELLSRCSLYQALWAAHIGAQTWAVTSGEKEGS